jgi:hypothetical protein
VARKFRASPEALFESAVPPGALQSACTAGNLKSWRCCRGAPAATFLRFGSEKKYRGLQHGYVLPIFSYYEHMISGNVIMW